MLACRRYPPNFSGARDGKMKNVSWLGTVGALVFFSSACTQGFDGDADVGSSQDELYGGGTVSTFWPGGAIPVCFAAAGNQTLRDSTRSILADNWSRVANLPFSGFGTCSTSNPANTIRVIFQANSNGFTSNFGPTSSGSTNVTLTSNGTPEHYRYEVLHEFGHAIGFRHDQQRPDNWDVNGNPIYCPDSSGGTSAPGGNYYGGGDNLSIMSYCAGWPTHLSATDVFGLRQVYGSTNPTTCQQLSDTYGIVAYSTFGFAPSGVQTLWTSMGCLTSPSSGDSLRGALRPATFKPGGPRTAATPSPGARSASASGRVKPTASSPTKRSVPRRARSRAGGRATRATRRRAFRTPASA
jgi:hypothetical protein